MATKTHGSAGATDVTSRSAPKFRSTGTYNRVTKVAASTTVAFTGSMAAAAFIVEDVTNVTITAVDGGEIPGSSVLVDTVYQIAPQKVAIGSDGIVHVLHR